jgi:hypothetical protein
VGPPHRPAAGHSEGGTDLPLSPQVARPHQEPDQPAGVQGAGGTHSAATRFGRTRLRKRPPQPPRGLTLPSERLAAPPLRSAGRGPPVTSLAAAVRPTRKTNRPAAGPYTAATARFIQTCGPPLIFCTRISHSHVFLTCKKLNFPSRFAK